MSLFHFYGTFLCARLKKRKKTRFPRVVARLLCLWCSFVPSPFCLTRLSSHPDAPTTTPSPTTAIITTTSITTTSTSSPRANQGTVPPDSTYLFLWLLFYFSMCSLAFHMFSSPLHSVSWAHLRLFLPAGKGRLFAVICQILTSFNNSSKFSVPHLKVKEMRGWTPGQGWLLRSLFVFFFSHVIKRRKWKLNKVIFWLESEWHQRLQLLFVDSSDSGSWRFFTDSSTHEATTITLHV